LRRIVSRGFTPRAVDGLRDALAERAQQIMHTALSEGTGDFVTDVACELPLQAIAELLGVPQDDRRKIFEWSNQMIAYDDPEYEVEPETAAVELLGYSMAMAEERKRCPMDDIVTKLVQADVDGRGPATRPPATRSPTA
jgi:cholest-4-en-3-one 26-monooxygenase